MLRSELKEHPNLRYKQVSLASNHSPVVGRLKNAEFLPSFSQTGFLFVSIWKNGGDLLVFCLTLFFENALFDYEKVVFSTFFF